MDRAPSRRALVLSVDGAGGRRREALRARIAAVIATINDEPVPASSTAELLDQLSAVLADAKQEHAWLALATISGRLPDEATVLRTVRATRLDGPLAAVAPLFLRPRLSWTSRGESWPTVEIRPDAVIIDLHHTARTDLATGIQRVAREVASRWQATRPVTLVGWNRTLTALRELSPAEQDRALHGGSSATEWGTASHSLVVPWNCRYVLPELTTEASRSRALLGMLRFSGTTGTMIGFDCVPLSSAETIGDGMGAAFASMLAAAAQMEQIATISTAAATEYSGWRTMLAGAGLRGPQITAVALPTEARGPSADAHKQVANLLGWDGLPLVLCVGSHEPRKNHLAVLHAAELLWRNGVAFSLAFVGGNAWNSERFRREADRMAQAGRPIRTATGLDDDLLWAAYRLARCTVFPSLNEGFGLPVAESLAVGTPVITSAFGSMREIAEAGGSMLVDPHDDIALAEAMKRLITDDDVHARLSAEARARPTRTWDQYADQTWEILVTGSHRPAATLEGMALPAGPVTRRTWMAP